MIFVERDPESRLIHLQLIFRTGHLADPKEKAGLANFTARSLLRGTRGKSFSRLQLAIEELGGTLDAEVDSTLSVIRGTVLATHYSRFVDLILEIFTESSFDEQEIANLRRQIQGEMQTALQDSRVISARAMMQLAYAGNALERPTIGVWKDVERLSGLDAKAFYEAQYTRGGLLAGITGPLPVEEMKQGITRIASALPATDAAVAPCLPSPSLRGRRATVVDRKEMATTPLFIAIAGVADSDPDLLALEVGNHVFGEDFTSRLMQVLRAENGWTYGAYSAFDQLIAPKAEPALFSIYTFPSTQYFAEAVRRSLELLERYAQTGITASDLRAARSALGNRYPFALDTAEKRLSARLREHLTGRKFRSWPQYRTELDALRLEQVNEAITRRTVLSPLAISAVGNADQLKSVLTPLVESVDIVDIGET